MRVLVTGAAGFIGSHVAEQLLARGETVAGLDNFDPYYDPIRKRSNVQPLLAYPRFTLHEVDIRDAQAVLDVCTSGHFDVVVHLAALAGVRSSVERASLYVDVNVRGTVNVLDGARHTGIPHVVLASTSSVYGRSTAIPFREDGPTSRPLAPYPATKLAAELIAHAYHNLFGITCTVLRFFSVYGPRGRPDMMPYRVVDCVVHDREFELYAGGEMYRDWTYISDIVAGVLAASERPLGYQIVNLGRGEPVRMADFVRLIETLIGKPARVRAIPAPPSEPPITYADITRARELLNYCPTVSIAEGMQAFWEWYQREVALSLS